MNGSQDLNSTGGNDLSLTNNPQSAGGQSLYSTTGGLQSSSSSLLSSNSLKISAVDSSNFQTANSSSPVSNESLLRSTGNLASILVIVLIIVAIVSVVLIVFANKKRKLAA